MGLPHSILKLFASQEALVAIDIGGHSIKLVELDTSDEKPVLVTLGCAPTSPDVFSQYAISRTDKLGEIIRTLYQGCNLAAKRIVTAAPGPSVFTKQIKMAKMKLDELRTNVQFEASNFIPHSLDAVRLDFHVIGPTGKNQLDILVAAAKNEIVDGLLGAFGAADLEVAVVDVDAYALQNAFETNYPEELQSTVAVLNVGMRYTTVNICKGGQSLFSGDIGVGGKQFSDGLVEALGVSAEEAEMFKRGHAREHPRAGEAEQLLGAAVGQAANEINRQLSFFWSAAGAEDGIEKILVSGGGAQLSGLLEEIGEKTGISTAPFDPLREITVAPEVDSALLAEVRSSLAIAIGLGVRQAGDRILSGLEG